MAYRAITDDVAISTSLNQLSHFAERLYWRMLSRTDAWGRLPGETVKIRDLTIPRLAVTDNELASALEELVRAGRVTLYCEAGVWACQLLDFDRHQPVAQIKRKPSRWPAPPQTDTLSGETSDEKSLQNRRSTDRETETEVQRISTPTAVARYDELQISNSERPTAAHGGIEATFHQWNLHDVCRGLRGADDRSPYALGSVLRGLPEGSLATAIESLEKRRSRSPRIDSEVRYLVGTLAHMREQAGLPSVKTR